MLPGRVRRTEPGPGQESVWDYPRPPRVELVPRRVVVRLGGDVVADSGRALRVLETSHPPVYYVPAQDVAPGALAASPRTSYCEFKGVASYWEVNGGGRREADAAWSYPTPSPGYGELAGAVAFYPGRMDSCTVGRVLVTPQAGGFYGGWITPEIVGPYKGEPGTSGW